MKERPILFCGDMVRAVLDGRKTETRRVIDLDLTGCLEAGMPTEKQVAEDSDGDYLPITSFCKHGQTGDRLYVKETWQPCHECGGSANYRADEQTHCSSCDKNLPGPWKPSIFMPRWACRILLEIVEVRVERVQEIDCIGALNEGVRDFRTKENDWDLRDCYRDLWDDLNKKRGFCWDKNPWVWVIQFRKVKP